MVINKSQPYKIYISTLFHSKVAFSKTEPSKAANKPYITSIWHSFSQTYILLEMVKWWACLTHLFKKIFFKKRMIMINKSKYWQKESDTIAVLLV